jgi:hypothetical protein
VARPTLTPTRKVSWGLFGSSAATVIVWFIKHYLPDLKDMPTEEAVALVSFVVSYLVPPSPTETTTTVNARTLTASQ